MLLEALNMTLFLIALSIASVIGYSYIRSVHIARNFSRFRCYKCGKCCSDYRIGIKEKDIARIEEHGFSRKDFMSGRHIRKIDGRCFFLKKKGDDYICSIHGFKPDVCRKWPLVRVGPFRIVRVFSCPGMARINRLKF